MELCCIYLKEKFSAHLSLKEMNILKKFLLQQMVEKIFNLSFIIVIHLFSVPLNSCKLTT